MERASGAPDVEAPRSKKVKLDATALKAQLAQRLSKLKSKVHDAPGARAALPTAPSESRARLERG